MLLPYTNSLWYIVLKKPPLKGTVIQELTRQSKIHKQSIHSTATKTIIETREYFSISMCSRKHQASFYGVNVLVLHKLCSQKFILELTFQPIPPQSNWKECSGSSSGFRISGFSIRPWIVLLLLLSFICCKIELKYA